MKSVIRSHWPRIAATTVVLAGVAGAVAYATIPAPNGVISACYAKANGGLRVVDAPSQTCSAKETALTWNQTGQTGARGPSDAYATDGGADPVNFSGQGINVIATVSLPAGSFVFDGKVLVGNRDVGDAEVTCTLRYGLGNAVQIDISTTRLSAGAPSATGSIATLPFAGSRTFATPTDVNLICNSTSADNFAQYAKINAVQVATLSGP